MKLLNQNKMEFAGKTHIVISLIITLLSPILLPLFGQWYHQQTGIDPVGIYAVYTFVGLVNWMLIGFKLGDS